MTEWRELKTGLEVFQAKEAGDEIEYYSVASDMWCKWYGQLWREDWNYRARPRKKTKTVVLREYLVKFNAPAAWFSVWCEEGAVPRMYFGQPYKKLDTPERVVEVEE